MDTFAWTGEQMRSWQAAQDAERVLATILFTDIVRSTEQAAAIGDQRWRRLLDRHDEVARTEVDRFRGRLVKSTGDGILATFDAPTRALRCAFALTDALGRRGAGRPQSDRQERVAARLRVRLGRYRPSRPSISRPEGVSSPGGSRLKGPGDDLLRTRRYQLGGPFRAPARRKAKSFEVR